MFLVAAGQYPHRVAEAVFAPQAFLEDMRIVGDQLIGGLQDAAGTTIVLFELDDFKVGVIVLKLVQIFGARAAPGVHGLVVVADHGERAAVTNQEFHEFILTGIGILILIDE